MIYIYIFILISLSYQESCWLLKFKLFAFHTSHVKLNKFKLNKFNMFDRFLD